MIDQIGCDWFSGISSDSTGNTQLACEIVVKEIPTIIILPNPCHHMNNTAKNIGGLDYWNEVCNNLILVYWFCHTCDSSTLCICIGPDAHTCDSSTLHICIGPNAGPNTS